MDAQLEELRDSCIRLIDVYRSAVMDTSELEVADDLSNHIHHTLDQLRTTDDADEAERIVGRTIAGVAAINQLLIRPVRQPGCWN